MNVKVSGQLLIAIALLFGIQTVGQAKHTPTYKVERCDCLGFSADIPTFLSDLAGAEDLDQLYIYGEGQTLEAAEMNAQKLCLETYRSYASASSTEDPSSVTQSGCKKLKSTPDGEWVALN